MNCCHPQTEGSTTLTGFLLLKTPMILSSEPEGIESQPILAAQRSRALLESTSTTKASRLSVSQSYNDLSSRPIRSSLVTRSSTSTSLCSSYSSNRSSSILNTTSVSVSSYTRSSSPVTRSPSVRPSNPSSRLTLSRPSTPSRTGSALTTSSIDPRPVQSSRPSTPCSRPQIPAFSSQGARLNSHPSSPTHRLPVCSPSPASGPSISTGCNLSYQSNAAPASRPNYPGPRVGNPLKQLFPLISLLKHQQISKLLYQIGQSLLAIPDQELQKNFLNTTSNANAPRRHSSLTISRGRLTDFTGRGRLHANAQYADVNESQKAPNVHDMAMKKPLKTSISTTENNGFGRTISKKSLDMAIRHMDIRNGSGNVRSLSSTTLFPQSVRSAVSKTQSVHSRST